MKLRRIGSPKRPGDYYQFVRDGVPKMKPFIRIASSIVLTPFLLYGISSCTIDEPPLERSTVVGSWAEVENPFDDGSSFKVDYQPGHLEIEADGSWSGSLFYYDFGKHPRRLAEVSGTWELDSAENEAVLSVRSGMEPDPTTGGIVLMPRTLTRFPEEHLIMMYNDPDLDMFIIYVKEEGPRID